VASWREALEALSWRCQAPPATIGYITVNQGCGLLVRLQTHIWPPFTETPAISATPHHMGSATSLWHHGCSLESSDMNGDRKIVRRRRFGIPDHAGENFLCHVAEVRTCKSLRANYPYRRRDSIRRESKSVVAVTAVRRCCIDTTSHPIYLRDIGGPAVILPLL
jgi:hypothetical protein